MATTSEYKKPLLPHPTSAGHSGMPRRTSPHLPTLHACGTRVFYPRDVCPGPECFGVGTSEWVESSGKGWVYASSISYQPAHPAFADDVPYVLAIIELDEGVRMHSNVVGIDPKEVEIGMRVEVAWDDVTPEFSLPKFRPIQK